MKTKKVKTKKIDIWQILIYIILFIGVFFMLIPFVWMVLCTFKAPSEILKMPPTFFPEAPTLSNYVKVWNKVNFSVFFRNSLMIVSTIVAIQIYSSALIGYVFAKMAFKGRDIMFTLVLSCMMVPWPVTIIPLYQQMVWFHWVDSYKAIIIPGMVSLFGIFTMKQFATSLPTELIEAARIDGAKEFGIFHKIIFPMLKPAVSALLILQFLWVWDDFLWPYLMLTDSKKFTIPIGMSLLNGQYYVDYASMMTGACISVVPVLTLYIIFQKKFVEGIAMTGIKG